MSYELVNKKVLKVRVNPGASVLARAGAMLGYTGDVTFRPVQMGGNVGGTFGRMLAGEHERLMETNGSGEVHYGYRGHALHIVELNGSTPLCVEASRLLCHDTSLNRSTKQVGGGSATGGGGGGFGRMLRGAAQGVVTGQGLYTTELIGQGRAAILAHGDVIEMQVGGSTVVDPQSYLGHLGNIQTELATALSWRDAVGRGSGEGMQLKITGQGTVYVQTSEQKI